MIQYKIDFSNLTIIQQLIEMISNFIDPSSSASNYETQLIRLNEALKTELNQCYSYIQKLQTESKTNGLRSVQFPHHNDFFSNQILNLTQQLEKLTNKLNKKRGQIKKLQKICLQFQQSLIQTNKEKEQIQLQLHQCHQANNLVSQANVNQFEEIIAQQRKTIQLYNRELQSKDVLLETYKQKVCEVEKERSSKEIDLLKQQNTKLNLQIQIRGRQIQSLKLTNTTLETKIQELNSQIAQNNEKNNKQIRELESKHTQAINEIHRTRAELQISKRTHTDVDGSFLSRVSVFSSVQDNSFLPNSTRRITIDDYEIRQKQHNQKQQMLVNINNLQQKIKSMQEEKMGDQNQLLRLKQNLVNIKIEYSNIVCKNTQLAEDNCKLEREKSDLWNKLYDKDSTNMISPSNAGTKMGKLLNRSNTSIMRSGTSNNTLSHSGFPSVRITIPNDGEVPVRDKNSARSSHVCISFNNQQSNTQFHPLRKSSAVIRTFK